MERGKDNRNILIIGLLVVVLIMSVGFALLSSQLEVNATGTISGDWAVKFRSGSLVQTNVTDGVSNIEAELDTNGLKVTLKAEFVKPGDKVSYRVIAENTGSINAYLKDITGTGTTTNTDAIKLLYEVKDATDTITYAKGSLAGNTLTETTEPISTATLLKKNGDAVDINYVDLTLEYSEDSEEIAPGATATYTLYLYYEQEKASANND